MIMTTTEAMKPLYLIAILIVVFVAYDAAVKPNAQLAVTVRAASPIKGRPLAPGDSEDDV